MIESCWAIKTPMWGGLESTFRLQTDDLKGFRPYNDLVNTLLHELFVDKLCTNGGRMLDVAIDTTVAETAALSSTPTIWQKDTRIHSTRTTRILNSIIWSGLHHRYGNDVEHSRTRFHARKNTRRPQRRE